MAAPAWRRVTVPLGRKRRTFGKSTSAARIRHQGNRAPAEGIAGEGPVRLATRGASVRAPPSRGRADGGLITEPARTPVTVGAFTGLPNEDITELRRVRR